MSCASFQSGTVPAGKTSLTESIFCNWEHLLLPFPSADANAFPRLEVSLEHKAAVKDHISPNPSAGRGHKGPQWRISKPHHPKVIIWRRWCPLCQLGGDWSPKRHGDTPRGWAMSLCMRQSCGVSTHLAHTCSKAAGSCSTERCASQLHQGLSDFQSSFHFYWSDSRRRLQ